MQVDAQNETIQLVGAIQTMVHAVTPIIPLISDFHIKELQYLKHLKKTTIAAGIEEYTKVRVPIIDYGASDEELLYFVMQFFRAVAIMEWNNGSCCLHNFERHLQGSYLSDWTQVVAAATDAAPAQPPVHSMDFLTDTVGNFMANLFDEADWTEQANCIQMLHKPKTMTLKHFLSQLQHLVLMLALFPQAPANIFTEDELKYIFLYAYPTTERVHPNVMYYSHVSVTFWVETIFD
jgi:hypothetical protein